MTPREPDVAIIGAGPAGLAAAIAAREAGAEGVLVLERSDRLGGILPQCIHNGFGLHYFHKDLTGPQYARHFAGKGKDLGVDFLLDTAVIQLSRERELVAASQDGLLSLKPRAIVLAMGCRERTRASVNIPGSRPAGIFTAGTAQRLINIEGYLPGRRIVVLGSGDIGMIMARRLTLEGCQVEAVVEVLPYPSGSPRNEVQCLRDFDIPLLLEHTVVDIQGQERVESVTIARVDDKKQPIPGTERRIECDTLLLSVGLVPENELSAMAGIELDPLTGGPVVDERMETCVAGIFACGNVVYVHDLVDYVTWEGEVAGLSAARYAQGQPSSQQRRWTVRPGRNIRYVVPQTISGQKDAALYIRVAAPEDEVELRVEPGLARKRLPRVRPSETLKLRLPAQRLGDRNQGELTVSCIRMEKHGA
jgi:NADPH-dependent 2,4-dienoyl-CoA reductase/sulfur reductase-like enzyme